MQLSLTQINYFPQLYWYLECGTLYSRYQIVKFVVTACFWRQHLLWAWGYSVTVCYNDDELADVIDQTKCTFNMSDGFIIFVLDCNISIYGSSLSDLHHSEMIILFYKLFHACIDTPSYIVPRWIFGYVKLVPRTRRRDEFEFGLLGGYIQHRLRLIVVF